MPAFRTLDDADVAGKRVLVRVDLNLPMQDGKVTDTTRIDRVLPTIEELSARGARVVLLAHFGRPKGRRVPEMSLRPVARALSDILGRPVTFADDCIGEAAEQAIAGLKNGDIALLENLRFHPGEEKNDPAFADALAALGDIFVSDAFSCAHRAHASTVGLAERLPTYAGRCMEAELSALNAALENPAHPVAAVVGGAKVSTKLDLLGNLLEKVDYLMIGGGMANTFLAAKGFDVGKSLCEHDLAATAREIMDHADGSGCRILLPVDALLAKEFAANAPHRVAAIEDVGGDEMILDAGPETVKALTAVLRECRTLVWNGPMGAFEIPPFDTATVALARAAAELTKAGRLLSVAGGGDTVAALNHAGVAGDFTYVSTAGGAFLEWLEGKTLPGVAALMQ